MNKMLKSNRRKYKNISNNVEETYQKQYKNIKERIQNIKNIFKKTYKNTQ